MESPTETEPTRSGWRRVVDVRSGEGRAFGLSATLFFGIFVSYYMVRGLRDELGISQGLENLGTLWQWTALVSLALHPVIGFAVARFPRRVFVPAAFLLAAAAGLTDYYVLRANAFAEGEAPNQAWLLAARVFYVGLSIWVMLASTLFWSLMADVWRAEQGKRLFGPLATGGTVGGIIGPFLLAWISKTAGPNAAILPAAVILIGCAFVGHRITKLADGDARTTEAERKGTGGGVWAGMIQVLRSPYLRMIAGFILLITIANGFLYFQVSGVLKEHVEARADRTAIFATMDAVTNALTLVGQGWLAAVIVRRYSVGVLLALMPLIAFVGFSTLALLPLVFVVCTLNVAQRAGRYALARPGRAMLFTAVPREERYKAQNFIDVVLYRAGDVGTAQLHGIASNQALPFLGAGVPTTAALVAPTCLLCAGLGLALGRRFDARAAEPEA